MEARYVRTSPPKKKSPVRKSHNQSPSPLKEDEESMMFRLTKSPNMFSPIPKLQVTGTFFRPSPSKTNPHSRPKSPRMPKLGFQMFEKKRPTVLALKTDPNVEPFRVETWDYDSPNDRLEIKPAPPEINRTTQNINLNIRKHSQGRNLKALLPGIGYVPVQMGVQYQMKSKKNMLNRTFFC